MNMHGDNFLSPRFYEQNQAMNFWDKPRKTHNHHSKKMAAYTLPLDEIAKKEILLYPTKSPAAILHALLIKREGKPKYKYIKIEEPGHLPIFKSTVTSHNLTAFGTGRNKRDAKNSAAKNFLEKLLGCPVIQDEGNLLLGSETSIPVDSIQDKIPWNPIGQLQDMCLKRKWWRPVYEMKCAEGPQHERRFTITCTVYKYCVEGSGLSKRSAKQAAAFKMWMKLQEINMSLSHFSYTKEISDDVESTSSDYSDMNDSDFITSMPSRGGPDFNALEFRPNWEQNYHEHLNELLQKCHISDGTFNYNDVLRRFALEKQLEVSYVNIEEKTSRGEYQCLVELSPLPEIICYGSGVTPREAQVAAARHAIEYLNSKSKN